MAAWSTACTFWNTSCSVDTGSKNVWTGFAYASLGANILRVAAVIILGLVKAQNGKESKDEYR